MPSSKLPAKSIPSMVKLLDGCSGSFCTAGGAAGGGFGVGCCTGWPAGVLVGWLGPPDVKLGRGWLGLPNELGCTGVVGVGGSEVVGVTTLGACVAGAAPFFARGYFRFSAPQTKESNNMALPSWRPHCEQPSLWGLACWAGWEWAVGWRLGGRRALAGLGWKGSVGLAVEAWPCCVGGSVD